MNKYSYVKELIVDYYFLYIYLANTSMYNEWVHLPLSKLEDDINDDRIADEQQSN